MEWRIKQLSNRLALLGYGTSEVKIIVKDAIGNESVDGKSFVQRARVVRHLERYEQLGSHYLQTYSQ